jgi:hypothetical protein
MHDDGAALDRTLSVLVISLPGYIDDAIDFGLDVPEGGIVETLAQPTPKLIARQLDVALADTRPRCSFSAVHLTFRDAA